jgi:hypothetical protein
MFRRLKRELKASYVGAIALGYMLAQLVYYFVGAFAAPVTSFVSEAQYQRIQPTQAHPPGLLYIAAAPDLIRFVLMALIWYGLFYWLYLSAERESNPTQPVAHAVDL